MGQIIKSLVPFCQSVCKHSYGRNFDLILMMKLSTVIRGPKCKIEFVWDKNLIIPFLILPQILKKFALRPMGTSKRYNSVPVKDDCTLCLPTPYFRGRATLRCYLNLAAIATIQNLQNFALKPMEISQRYNSVPVKENCALSAPNPLFLGPGYPMVSLKFLPCRPNCIVSTGAVSCYPAPMVKNLVHS